MPMTAEVTVWAAFFAGLLSFVSPCVLPLVPPYLCFLTGTSLEQMTGEEGEARVPMSVVMPPAAAFVLGFATVFVALGATASAAGQVLRDHIYLLSQIAGVAIIVMGLHFLGVFRLAFLSREARYHHDSKPAGLAGAFAIGLAFAFGWTPCIGPVLAPILGIAATEETVAAGAGLLAVYSAGLGVPFLLAALGIRQFLAFMKRFRRHLGVVEKAMGGLLVVTGVLFLTGGLQTAAYWLLETFPVLGRIG
jgi:cytochrome c-type biogenesis protein